jgi:hypothetical protein
VIHNLAGPTPNSSYGARAVILNDYNGDGRAEFTTQEGFYPWAPQYFPVFNGLDASIIATLVNPPSSATVYSPNVMSMANAGDVYPDGRVELMWGTQEWFQNNQGGYTSAARVRVFSFAPVFTASTSTIGAGCGSPAPILAMQPPILGTAPWLGLWNASPQSTGYLFLSAQTTQSTPIGNGCTVYLDLPAVIQVLSFVTSPSGFWATQVPFTQSVFFAGIAGRLQAAILPPSGGLELTNAVDFALGY